MITDRLVERIDNDLAELARLAAIVDAFCARNGLPPRLAFELNLAFDELVTNTVSYGYDDGGRHTIEVRIRRDGELLTIELEDDARPYDPLDAPEPDLDSPVEDRPIGGLGVHLVKTMMDSVDYRRVGERNLLTMTRRIDGAAPADERSRPGTERTRT